MKVIYEEDYAPFINYNDAYVYLDTNDEELSILTGVARFIKLHSE